MVAGSIPTYHMFFFKFLFVCFWSSVNQFMPTGVFNPFKLTGRSVIIGSLGLLYHFTEIVVSFNSVDLIRHYFIRHLPCVYVGSALFVKFLYTMYGC